MVILIKNVPSKIIALLSLLDLLRLQHFLVLLVIRVVPLALEDQFLLAYRDPHENLFGLVVQRVLFFQVLLVVQVLLGFLLLQGNLSLLVIQVIHHFLEFQVNPKREVKSFPFQMNKCVNKSKNCRPDCFTRFHS